MNKLIGVLVAIGFLVLCVVVLFQGSDESKETGDKPGTEPASGQGAKGPAPSGEELALLHYSSSAKRKWIDQATALFNQKNVKVGDKVVRVKIEHVTSGGSFDQIAKQGKKVELWSPGDESWIRLANEHGRSLNNKAMFGPHKPLVNVPLCVAMWEPMAKALGYPNPIGWKDLAKFSTEPNGWGAHGHPEWGKFKWGHAHPNANSGFLTVISEVYAHFGKSTGLTVDDLKNPGLLEHLKKIEYAVEHYGMSNSWIDKFMREKGPAYLSAAAQYENTIIQSNIKHGSKPFRLLAVYPKEGAFFAKHPIAIPEGEWVTEEKREAANKYIEFLLSEDQQIKAMRLGLRPIRQGIALEDPFTAANGVMPKLPDIPEFEAPGERILARIRDLWLDAKKPASIVLLLDVSGSMSGAPIEGAKRGADSFIQSMHLRDELEVVTFSNNISRLVSLGPVSKVGETARQKVKNLFAGGGTHLYDAVDMAYKSISTRRKTQPQRHYGIIILSDGQDSGSTLKVHDLIDTLPKGDNPEVVKMFTIAYGDKADIPLLKKLSNLTNARMFASTTEEIQKVYTELSANF